ncbi:MAG: hypothetical protein QM766_21150 [Burkholderiaceae bacterium]
MNHALAETTRSLVGWLTSTARRVFDGAPTATDEDAPPSPAASIDHPTYLRRRIEIDGVTSPCPIDWSLASWQARLPH